MSETNDGTASGDYDNETASLIEKLLDGKRDRVEPLSGADHGIDRGEESLKIWENDGGRCCNESSESES